MSEKKAIKKAVRAAWDNVKALRAERAKLYGAGEISESADKLSALASELQGLAKQVSALSAMQETEASPKKPKQKRKAAANDAA